MRIDRVINNNVVSAVEENGDRSCGYGEGRRVSDASWDDDSRGTD